MQTQRLEAGAQMRFRLADLDMAPSPTGRSIYVHQPANGERTLYLYHSIINEFSGVGRWVVNDDVNSRETALAWVDSWAVAPHMIGNNADGDINRWHSFMVYDEDGNKESVGRWEPDPDFLLYCEGEDTTVLIQPLLLRDP